jgi:superfamily II DNA or RNA helicase
MASRSNGDGGIKALLQKNRGKKSSTIASAGKRRKKKKSEKKLSRQRKPDEMPLETWQVELRRQFGREQKYRLKNLGNEPIFSDFEVANPLTHRTYRLAIRGAALGENYCSCPDFAVNTLGTCKHIEFTLDQLARRPGAKTTLALGHQPTYSEVYLQYGARREVVFHPGTECSDSLKRLARNYFDAQYCLKPESYAKFHVFLHKASINAHEFRCYSDALAFIAQVRDGEHLRQRVAKMFSRGIRGGMFKKLLKVPLYPYQREGAIFAAKAGRCLIADEMGLGKTIQAIAAAEILARTADIERVLVVAPTSLKHQWKQEIEKFTGRQALVVEGSTNGRADLYAADSFFKLTNYDVIHRDLEPIRRWQPDLIILDEAQRIKNWKTRTAQSVKQLESKFAFVLTGTPLENRLEELHSIIEFVDRFRLGPMFRFLDQHQHVDDHGRVVGYRNLSKISQSLEPILIRRTKDKVLKDLPERLEKKFFVPMTEQQMELHEENREVVGRVVQKWRRFGFLNEADQLRLQIALQNMRMSCNSTYLLDQKTDHGVKADELVDLLEEIFEEKQSKVVVFSQWLRMHEVVMRRLERRKWRHVLFHGGVPGPKRKDLIQQFKEDPDCRLFLSTDAGGVGLNLQTASAVVSMDQPWNPAVLEQRIGRVHRLGQHRPVRVVHFIAQGTIEEGMLGLLAFKKSMFAGVLDGGDNEVFLGGTRLNQFMQSVEKATGAIPEKMPAEPDRIASREQSKPAKQQPPDSTPREAAWADILSSGMSLLEKISGALSVGKPQKGSSAKSVALPRGLLATDESTGKPYLKLPLPKPELLEKITDLLESVFSL